MTAARDEARTLAEKIRDLAYESSSPPSPLVVNAVKLAEGLLAAEARVVQLQQERDQLAEALETERHRAHEESFRLSPRDAATVHRYIAGLDFARAALAASRRAGS